MKRGRVAATVAVAVAVLLVFFLVPLPVSRVRSLALVQPQPEASVKVTIEFPATLEKLLVRDGQTVQEGQVLAEFRSLDVETQLQEAITEREVRATRVNALRQQWQLTPDRQKKTQIQVQIEQARGEERKYYAQVRAAEDKLQRLSLKAPRAGVVMGSPRVDDVGKLWDKDASQPFCTIGDWKRLQALMPVPPEDHRLLTEDIKYLKDRNEELPVTIRVQGRAERTWHGKVAKLQETEAREVPFQLTAKGGGPLAVKPSGNPNVHVPQNQVFLVAVNFQDPDSAICPGTLAQVKIHCRWRSAAWWVWRTVSSTFDLQLM
jgi:putative peptide zinc metalloprotease protein